MTAGSTRIAEAVCANDGTVGEPVSADAPAQPRRLRIAKPVNAAPIWIAEAMDPSRSQVAEAVSAETDCPDMPYARGLRIDGR